MDTRPGCATSPLMSGIVTATYRPGNVPCSGGSGRFKPGGPAKNNLTGTIPVRLFRGGNGNWNLLSRGVEMSNVDQLEFVDDHHPARSGQSRVITASDESAGQSALSGKRVKTFSVGRGVAFEHERLPPIQSQRVNGACDKRD
jgi:hypothetical protein